MMISSNSLDSCVRIIVEKTDVVDDEDGYDEVSSQKTMKFVRHQDHDGRPHKLTTVHSVYTDHVKGLNDMLNLHGDWRNVSTDMLIANKQGIR